MARPICLLLVDTDPTYRDMVRGALRRRADMMLAAGSIAEARQRLEQSAVPIDWIMIDPAVGDDALSFAEETRNRHPGIGILLTSDSPLVSGFRHLQKPFGTGDLWAALAR